ncbi:MAG: thiolase family protein [Gammaproteobacteria bacterium]|nr:thiolase family protein [Gammaproteobacteria bacterium]MYF01712.1 thiolase family protein [Gammaproteobacteria bacterium]MYI77330.1 thiolase family protein [Gammaproteobacteria bacterium]
MNTFVLGAKRTPIGSFQGALTKLTAPDLGAHAIRSATEDATISMDVVDEVFMGNVISAGLRQAPARQAALSAGISEKTPTTTVNKVCGSGMQASMLGTDLISVGRAKCIVTGGMESMTNAPYLVPKARLGLRMGHKTMQDAMFCDGLEDAESGRSMGSFAQEIADLHQMTRDSMDEFAIGSLKKALHAMDSGVLAKEISTLDELGEDEQPRKSRVGVIPTMRPAFAKNGTITAANASSISDGASAIVLANEQVTAKAQVDPLARVVAHVSVALHPSQFVLAPILAIRALLEKTGWQKESVDIFEINEAFAMVTMLAIQELQLDPARVNVYGGSCAQGHPLGSTGSRLIVTLAHAMQAQKFRRGVASLCIGGGEGTAIALERD